MNGLAVVDPPSLLCRGDREADREMGFDTDSDPMVDIRLESFGPGPPKYKVH